MKQSDMISAITFVVCVVGLLGYVVYYASPREPGSVAEEANVPFGTIDTGILDSRLIKEVQSYRTFGQPPIVGNTPSQRDNPFGP